MKLKMNMNVNGRVYPLHLDLKAARRALGLAMGRLASSRQGTSADGLLSALDQLRTR